MSKLIVSVVQPTVSAPPGFQYIPLAWLGDADDVSGARDIITSAARRKDLKRGMLIAATEGDEWGRAVAFGRVVAATQKGAKIAMVRDGKMVDQDGAEVPASALGVGGIGRMFRSVGMTARGPIGLYSSAPVTTWLEASDAAKMALRAGAFDVRQKSLVRAAITLTELSISSARSLRSVSAEEKVVTGLRLASEVTSETRRWLSGQDVNRDHVEGLLGLVSAAEDDLNPSDHPGNSVKIKRIQKTVGAAWLTGGAILNEDSPGYTLSSVISHVNEAGYASPRNLPDIVRDHISAAEIVLSIACSNQLGPHP